MVVVYKWGGIAFDDKSLIKTLILPSIARDDNPITFHDNGVDYQVPVGKVFIVGHFVNIGTTTDAWVGRAGESDGADGAITRDVAQVEIEADVKSNSKDVLGVYTAGKYVTAESDTNTTGPQQYSTLYGVEIDA
ncbi:unnamed protein product [marine sediment metagenome]|uniref:Uncharacterized protein n=1 Tax=marine sediment metagenome TaxID=412755 RepID=X1UDI0_9ZZZZ